MKDVTKRFLMFCNHLIDRRKGFTLSDFIQKIGISRSLITEMQKGRSNVGLNTIQSTVISYPELNVDWILTGKGKMINDGSGPELKNTQSICNNIVMINAKNAAALPHNLDNTLYYQTLPSFTLPGKKYETGKFICLQAEGSAMCPTIKKNEWVIGREVENINFKNGYIHLIVTQDAVLCQRPYRKKNSNHIIELLSDNEAYRPQMIHESEIQRMYEAFDKITDDFQNWKADIKRNLSVLEAEIAQIKRDLYRTKKTKSKE